MREVERYLKVVSTMTLYDAAASLPLLDLCTRCRSDGIKWLLLE